MTSSQMSSHSKSSGNPGKLSKSQKIKNSSPLQNNGSEAFQSKRHLYSSLRRRKKLHSCLRFLHPLCSLRVLLCVSMVAIIVFVGTATTVTSYLSSQSSLSNVVDKFQLSLSLQISGFVDKLMMKHQQTLRTFRTMMHYTGGLDAFFEWDLDKRTSFFYSFVSSQQTQYGDNSGVLFASESNQVNYFSSKNSFGHTVPSSNATITNSTSVDLLIGPFNPSTKKVNFTSFFPDYKMFARPWYADAKTNAYSIYSGILDNPSSNHSILDHPSSLEFQFSSFTSVRNAVTRLISIPVVDASNSFRGVMALILETETISTFLKSLASAPDHHFFLLQRDGLVASSTQDHDIETTVLSKINRRYGQNYKALNKNNPYDSFSDGNQIISVSFLREDDWELIVVVVLPSSLLYDQVVTATVLSVVIVVVLMIVSSVAGLLSSYCATRPLFHIAKEMKKAKYLKLESIRPVQGGKWIYEYNAIIDSFHSLVRRLEEYRSFLPDYVIPEETSSEVMSSYTPVESFCDESLPKIEPEEACLSEVPSIASISEKSFCDSKRRLSVSSSESDTGADPAASHHLVRAPFKLYAGLSQRKMGLFFFRLHNADHLVGHNFVSHFEKIVEILSSEAGLHGALIDRMDYYQILIHFPEKDASICCAKMLRAAVHVDSQLKMLDNSLNSSHGGRLSYTISLCHGSLRAGVIGSHRNKTYTAIGAARENCWLFCKSGMRLGCRILFDESVYSLISSKYNNKHTTFLSVPVDIILGSGGRARVIYELVERIMLKDEEWMYKMAFNHAQKIHKHMKQGFDALLQGRIEEAEKEFQQSKSYEEIPAHYPDRMLRLCEYWRKHEKSSKSIVYWITQHTTPSEAWKISTEKSAQNDSDLRTFTVPNHQNLGFSLLYPTNDECL